jgi:hypothetical protein
MASAWSATYSVCRGGGQQAPAARSRAGPTLQAGAGLAGPGRGSCDCGCAGDVNRVEARAPPCAGRSGAAAPRGALGWGMARSPCSRQARAPCRRAEPRRCGGPAGRRAASRDQAARAGQWRQRCWCRGPTRAPDARAGAAPAAAAGAPLLGDRRADGAEHWHLERLRVDALLAPGRGAPARRGAARSQPRSHLRTSSWRRRGSPVAAGRLASSLGSAGPPAAALSPASRFPETLPRAGGPAPLQCECECSRYAAAAASRRSAAVVAVLQGSPARGASKCLSWGR